MATDWQREQARIARARAQEQKAAEKAAKEQYLADRLHEVEEMNNRLQEQVETMRGILVTGLGRSTAVSFENLKQSFSEPSLDLAGREHPIPQPDRGAFISRSPGPISRFFGGQRRYEAKKPHQERRYEQALRAWELDEAKRQDEVKRERKRHAENVAKLRAEVDIHNNRIDDQRRGFECRDREQVESYTERVLAAMVRPQGFPNGFEVTYSGSPREEILVRFELPGTDAIPSVAKFKYVKNADSIEEKTRPKKEVDELYRSMIAQLALLCLRDLFEADAQLQRVGFNGHVHAINPATGRAETPCLISVLVHRENFDDLVLDNVDPGECLKALQAVVSHHPYALKGVEPILDFDLTKYKFVDGLDAVSTLDSRPDLLSMGPEYFEHLIRQVFEANPEFQGWTTTRSNDDGVDAVVANHTTLVGGLAVVQAKRYKKPLGPQHIRELAGTMDEKRAGKGILVTTAWFTTGAEAKARENGRIELISGPQLKYLVKQNLGKEVLIGLQFPKKVTDEESE